MLEGLNDLNNKMLLNYYIVFKSSNNDMLNYSPLLQFKTVPKNDYNNTMHMLDPDLTRIISALKYILHLPRTGFDVIDIDEDLLLKSYDQPNNIILIPDKFIDMMGRNLSMPTATLIIYEWECRSSARKLERNIGARLGNISLNKLSSETLQHHWKSIWKLVNDKDHKSFIDYSKLELYSLDKLEYVPLIFYANQLNRLEIIQEASRQNIDPIEKIVPLQIEMHAHLAVYEEILKRPKEECDSFNKLEYLELLEQKRKEVMLPIVITMPGIAKTQVNRHGRSRLIPNEEKEMIKFLGLHRAVAKNAIYIELDLVSPEVFSELNKLEISLIEGTNNQYVWRTLRKLGQALSDQLSELQRYILMRAKHITVFSDFPIGLAILEGSTAPLCCYKQISYRPLTPLTKAIQYETPKEMQYYIGKVCKVIVAECLDKDDDIRKFSDNIWSELKRIGKNYELIEVIYKEIDSVRSLKSFLNNNQDAQFLVLSAHGSYDRKYNKAGLFIGKEVWMASDNDLNLPPVVLLSACHVSPRGTGAVSVADLLLRGGAVAVLGTFIPVNVNRNGLLMLRLFLYIAETQKGNHDFKTLDELWTFVVSSNAINEIIESDVALKEWIMKVRPDGSIPLNDFQQKHSVGKLRLSHIYQDTIEILDEMLKGEKLSNHLENIKNSENYFPESLFYNFIGYPENIFITNDVFEEVSRSSKKL